MPVKFPIKVLHIQKVAGIAGSENHLLTLLPRLSEYGCKPTMLALADFTDRPSSFMERLYSTGVPANLISMRADLDPLLAVRLTQYMQQHTFDLIHTHLVHADLYGTIAAQLAGIRCVVSTKHGFNPWRRKRRYALCNRMAAALQRRIIVISRAIGQWLVQVERLPAEKMRVVHYALDVQSFRQYAKTNPALAGTTRPIIGAVSRLIHQKGIHILIQAFASCAKWYPQASLVIIGEGPARSDLEAQARTLGIAERIQFLGYVVQPELNAIMQSFDIFAFPTFGEGFGLVLLEAMALDKPIVASKVMSIPEIVLDGETGLLVPPNDPDSLAQALLRLTQDQELSHKLGTAGRHRVEQEFTVEHMVHQTMRVYEEALNLTCVKK